MMKSKLVLALMAAAILFSGCYRTVYTGENLAYNATLNSPRQGEIVVEHFSIKKWNHFFISGLAPTRVLDVSEVLSERVPAGRAVRNLSIRQVRSFPNMFVAWLALGGLIYSPMTTVIEGDIVQVAGNVK